MKLIMGLPPGLIRLLSCNFSGEVEFGRRDARAPGAACPPGAIVRIVVAAILAIAMSLPAPARSDRYEYAGIEFYGSSRITRAELAKMIGIRPGASMKSVVKAATRLEKRLAKRFITGNVQIVTAPPNKVYVAVDVPDASQGITYPNRKLDHPRQVKTRSTKPDMLLNKLKDRLEKLASEGRPSDERIDSGVKRYSDPAANEIVEEMLGIVPGMDEDYLAMVNSDTNPEKRLKAIEILNFSRRMPYVCFKIMPALDDSDYRVRAGAARFLHPRIPFLPDNFPYLALVKAFSRQLVRPSHQDRSKSLHCLLSLCRKYPQLIWPVKELDEERINLLAEKSRVPSIKNPAKELKQLMANPPEKPIVPSAGDDDEDGFL